MKWFIWSPRKLFVTIVYISESKPLRSLETRRTCNSTYQELTWFTHTIRPSLIEQCKSKHLLEDFVHLKHILNLMLFAIQRWCIDYTIKRQIWTRLYIYIYYSYAFWNISLKDDAIDIPVSNVFSVHALNPICFMAFAKIDLNNYCLIIGFTKVARKITVLHQEISWY